MVRKGGRGASPRGVPDEPDPRLLVDVVAGRVLAALDDAEAALDKRGIRYWVVGGLAVGAWGHPRATKDVDFLVRQADVFEGDRILAFRPGIPIDIGGVPVDYLTVEGTDSPAITGKGKFAPIEVLFLLKLQAWRPQDQADLDALIRAGAPVEKIREFIGDRAQERARLDRLVRGARTR